MSESPTSARLTDLEVRVTFLDDALNALSDADAAQAQHLLALERAVHDLRAELAAIRTALGDDTHGEPPPPHY